MNSVSSLSGRKDKLSTYPDTLPFSAAAFAGGVMNSKRLEFDLDLNSVKSLLDYDSETGLFTWKESRTGGTKKGDIAGCNRDGYTRISVFGKQIAAHRLAWAFHYGEFPSSILDHANGNRSDNRIVNLRECTHSQNMSNSPLYKNNKSGYKGVYRHKDGKRWTSQIRKNKKLYYLGAFDSIDDAAMAYQIAAKEIHKEFSNFNTHNPLEDNR